jgi:hypothetical protein
VRRETFAERRAEWLRVVHERASRPNGQVSHEERIGIMRAKVRAWNGEPVAREKRSGTVRAPVGPPFPRPWAPVFSKHTPWEDFERWRVDLGARQLLVPSGALITGSDRAWRCEVSP